MALAVVTEIHGPRKREGILGMPEELNILLVEDVGADAEAMEEELRRGGLRFRASRIGTRQEFIRAIESAEPDLVLSDFTLPAFDGLSALRLLRARHPAVPFILVTSPRSEEVAMECVREGASDYILKSNLRRLPAAVTAALSRQTAERARTKAEQSLRSMPRLILEAQEAERRRVARDLHDSVNQMLSSAKFRLEALGDHLATRDAVTAREVLKTKEILGRAITEVRRISRNLRPSELDDLGLPAAIRTLGGEFSERTGIKLALHFPASITALPDEVELNIYRVIQEALNNIERHAHAQRVEISLEIDQCRLRVTVRDDGTGFQPARKARASTARPGMGLTDMRERATHLGGHCEIHTELGRGTEIVAVVPIQSASILSHASPKKRTPSKNPAAPRR